MGWGSHIGGAIEYRSVRNIVTGRRYALKCVDSIRVRILDMFDSFLLSQNPLMPPVQKPFSADRKDSELVDSLRITIS